MLRLQRYLVRETAGLFLLGVATFCLLLSIDLLSILARFLLEHEASAGTVGLLLLYKLPWFLHLSLPLALVFAILLATGRLARDSELKAIYAAGVSPRRLLTPLIGLGVIVTGMSIVNNGWIEPIAERAYQERIDAFIYVRPPNETQSDVAYRVPGRGIYYAARVIAQAEPQGEAELRGVVVLGDDGTVTSAPSGAWHSSERDWTLYRAETLRPGAGIEDRAAHTLPFDVGTRPEETLARTESLTLGELRDRIGGFGEIGGRVNELRFSFHRRVADASSAIVFALLAGALGVQLRGRGAGFGWTIVLLVAFWSVWFLAGNLFERNVLGPVAAAWFTPLAVGVPTLGYVVLRLGR